MGNQRSVICLKCGNRFYVDSEEYRLIKDNPFCSSCMNQKPSTEYR